MDIKTNINLGGREGIVTLYNVKTDKKSYVIILVPEVKPSIGKIVKFDESDYFLFLIEKSYFSEEYLSLAKAFSLELTEFILDVYKSTTSEDFMYTNNLNGSGSFVGFTADDVLYIDMEQIDKLSDSLSNKDFIQFLDIAIVDSMLVAYHIISTFDFFDDDFVVTSRWVNIDESCPPREIKCIKEDENYTYISLMLSLLTSHTTVVEKDKMRRKIDSILFDIKELEKFLKDFRCLSLRGTNR